MSVDAVNRKRVRMGQRGPSGTLMWVNKSGTRAKVLLDNGNWWCGSPTRLRGIR